MLQIPRWQILSVIGVLLFGLIFAAPNVLPDIDEESLPGWLPHKTVNLGLDLQGGSYLLMQVGLEEVFEQDLENLEDGLRREFRAQKILYKDLGVAQEAVGFELLDPAQRQAARQILLDLAGQMQVDITDDVRFSVRLTDEIKTSRSRSVIAQTIEIVRRRLDETGTREPSIQQSGDDRVLVQLPGVDDPQRIKDLLKQTAQLSFRFINQTANPYGTAPPGSEILEEAPDQVGEGQAPQRFVVEKRIMVKGENLVDAQGTFQDGRPVVSFTFDTVGAQRFGKATSQNVGRLFAIVLDDRVISAPVIREPILGGSGIISGTFTAQSANDLAILLRAGALPAPLSYEEERTVGPSLGADSVQAGKIAAAIGFLLVIIFMAASYGRFGLFADVALIANLVLLLAVLSTLQATLTLPGIAGIVLTIGMAVDANVLIFERIREEIHLNNRSPVTAIDAGYRRAMTTIIDSNLTTLIAAILLFQFGTGPVKGFAVTLTIGVITSMFTAIMLTRLLIVTWLRRRRPQALAL